MINLLRQLFVVSRPISWPNTAYPFAAGYFLLQQTVDARLIIGTLFFLIPYNLLLYGVNDVYDYESDIRNPRKGGIEGAKAAKRLHKPILTASAVLSLPFIATLMAMGSLLANSVLLLVLFFVLAYSLPILRFKERPVLDSITSSLHFVGPLIYAFSLTEFTLAGWVVVAAFFTWGMASHAFGAVQDIIPDKDGGLQSIATAFGAAATVKLVLASYAISGLVLLPLGTSGLLCSLIALAYMANVWEYRSISDTESHKTNKAWKRFIYLNLVAGFIITMLLIKESFK